MFLKILRYTPRCRHCGEGTIDAAVYCGQCGGYQPPVKVSEEVPWYPDYRNARGFLVSGAPHLFAAIRASRDFFLRAPHRSFPWLFVTSVHARPVRGDMFYVEVEYGCEPCIPSP